MTIDAGLHGNDDAALGNTLVEQRLLTIIQLQYAQQKQVVTGETLSQVLVRLGLVSETGLAKILAQHHGLPYQDATQLCQPQPQAIALFTREICHTHALLPLTVSDNQLQAVLGNGDPRRAEELIRRRTGLKPLLIQGDFALVSKRIDQVYSRHQGISKAAFEQEYQLLRQDTLGALPINELVHQLLSLAVSERATDLHLQPEPHSIHVSFRIDGVLIPIISLDRALLRLIAAIKVMSAMDISDNLRPQDGRFSIQLNRQAYDVRVSTSITPHGESLVMRLLQKGVFVSGLEDLGFLPEHLPLIDNMFCQPHGVFLLTGPTGSGKSTTLHAGLKPHGMTGKSILTVEDPIEYELPVACQTQVNRKAGYSFDTAIRHFLRHDPDIMLVGEIRDEETADAAIRAAETGHLVLSTLHVNSVFGVVSRLGSLGVSAQSLAETLIGSLNQRLIRKLCPHCKEAAPPPEKLPTALANRLQGVTLMHGIGCTVCRHTGYYGRLPVYEMLVVDAAIAQWIESGASRRELGLALNPTNHISMLDTFVTRIAAGETSIDEFIRLFGQHDLASAHFSSQI